MFFGLDTTGAAPGDHGAPSSAPSSTPSAPSSAAPSTSTLRPLLIAAERIALTLLAVAVSVLVPEFASVMAVLGATFSFLLCIIGPLCAKAALARRVRLGDAFLLALSAAMAVWGTVCAFESAEVEPLGL